MYRKLLLVLLIVFFVNSVGASKEADWLADRNNNGNWGNIRDTAFGIMALEKETGYENFVTNGSKYLINQLESCMPSNTCNVKDTAIAVWALQEVGVRANIILEAGTWLLNSRRMIFSNADLPSSSNKWYVQVVSNIAGSCVLTNVETGQNEIISVDTRHGYVPWHEIKAESVILTETTGELNLDCGSLGTNNLVLSMINKKPDANSVENYYIKQEESQKNNISVNFGTPCWGTSYRSNSCDKETSGYVLFALNNIGKPGDPDWLTKQGNLGLLENAFLYKITNRGNYLTTLVNEKNEQGYWGSADLFTTTMIYSLLKPNSVVDGVENFIASRRHGDGCWDKNLCSIGMTAVVLQSRGFQTSVQGCDDLDGDGICDVDDNDIDGDKLLNDIDPFPINPDVNSNGVLDGEEDYDGDGIQNYEDSDIDGDGVNNERDRDPWDETVGAPERRPGPPVTTFGDICTTLEGCPGRKDEIGQCVDVAGDKCPKEDVSDCEVGGFCVTIDDCSGAYSSSCRCIADADCEVGNGVGAPPVRKDDEGGVVLWILLVLLLLIILVGGGFLAYKKGLLNFKFSKKKKPEARYTPKLSSEKSKKYVPKIASRAAKRIPRVARGIEKELDKSMEDLEKLLGGK